MQSSQRTPDPGFLHTTIMLSPPGSASSSIMDQKRAAAGSSSQEEAQFPSQTPSSHYPPTSGAADYHHSSSNTFPQPSGTAVGAPEPSPPPSLLGQAAAGAQAGSSSFTSTWITPASTEELAAAGDDDDNSFADTDFVFENGRRYHAPASGRVVYPLPNDESEQERDDMKHKLALWMMHEKLLYAPVEEALKRGGMVFDLGMLPLPIYLDLSSLAFQTLHTIPISPFLSNWPDRPAYFLFSPRPLANHPAAASRPSVGTINHGGQGLGPWRAELNNMPLTWLFLFGRATN